MSDSSSLDDAKAEQSSLAADKRPFPAHWIVLGLLVVVNAAFGAYYSSREPAVAGFLTVQPILFSLWAAFALQPLFQRLLWPFFLCASMAFFEDLAAWKLAVGNLGDNLTYLPQIFAIATIGLLFIRLFFGWRIIRLYDDAKPIEYREYQFGLKHLILLITFAAVVLSFFRFLLNNNPRYNVSIITKQAFVFFTSIFILLIPAFVIIWTVLVRKSVRIFPVLIIAPALVIIAIIGADTADIFLHTKLRQSTLHELVLFILGACVSAFISAMLLRLCGYRLTRERKTA